jgi:hypothetical protein
MKKISVLLGLVIVLVLCQLLAHAQVGEEKKDVRLENFNRAVVDLRKAYAEKDVLKVTDLFNQQDLDSVGGYERFADFVGLGRSAAPEVTAKFGSPSKLDAVDGKWFGVVSFRMEWRVEKSLHIVETCLVGISADDGKTWRFKTGESFFKDYPELVGKIDIIERNKKVAH